MDALGILLAAGGSRRFGTADKLLADWRGRPLILAALGALQAAGCDEVAVVVSSQAVAEVLPEGLAAIRIEAGQEMAASFRAAMNMAERRGAKRTLIALADMPGVRGETLRRLLARKGPAACLGPQGARMPPLCLPARDYARAAQGAIGDQGARAYLQGLSARAFLPLSPAESMDIDRPDDLAAGPRGEPLPRAGR